MTIERGWPTAARSPSRLCRQGPLGRWDDNFSYRTISPRHFEAAAFRICQVMFEGEYSDVLRPMVHYVPLKKDFSNFDQVVELITDHDPSAKRSSRTPTVT